MLPDAALAAWLRDANPNVDSLTFGSRMSQGEVVLVGGGGVAVGGGIWSRQAVEYAGPPSCRYLGMRVAGRTYGSCDSSGYEETPRNGKGG